MKPRFVYVGGRFVPYRSAQVHVEDRGLQFGDAIYEVWAVLGGRLADAGRHFDRLSRNLDALQIPRPMSGSALLAVMREALRRNGVREGLVYVQVTRGAADRDHLFPRHVEPTVIVIARPVNRAVSEARALAGVSIVTQPDQRWGRCDLKTTNLLPNVLGKEAAKGRGATETWFTDREGFITEGASTTAWMVDRENALVTRPLGPEVLPGVTRDRLIELARGEGRPVRERAFRPEEAQEARELFLTAASAFVTPVIRLDERPVGDGRPGPVASALRRLYLQEARNAAL